MKPLAIIAAVAVYGTVLIATFGHAVNQPVDCTQDHLSDGWARRYVEQSCQHQHGMGAIFSSLFWPFYWSAQLQAGAP